MGLSIQTNVTSLIAQENLRTNTAFQNNTIQQLTSGYRINSSGDDAAGLAVANRFRSSTAELTQGVLNANNGISAFQTIDGGLSNISAIVDRLRTLATESASSTFIGDRNTLNNEYQTLSAEISRQAANIGLNTGGQYNTNIGVYIGGGSSLANAQVNVDLSGASNGVDASALGLAKTNIAGGGTSLATNVVRLDAPGALFAAGGTQALTFNIESPTGTASTVTATINGGPIGITSNQVVQSLNSQLAASGISASVGSNGQLQFAGSVAFSLAAVPAPVGGGNAIATTGATITANSGLNNLNAVFTTSSGSDETLTFQNGNVAFNVDLLAGNAASTIQQLNTQLQGSGISAVLGANGTDINFQSQNGFSVNETALAGGGGLFTALGAQTVTAASASASSTGNADAALTAISAAVTSLGLVQGHVGAGENLLADAVNLAQSQITNFSAANSRIRDADIATEAANLTKSQVLQQSSIAALAQANSAPQQLLTLLKG